MGTKITASWKNISFRLHGCPEDDTICLRIEYLFGDLNRFSATNTESVFIL